MLVCDDEPIVRILVRAALDREKYIMVVARDGNEALALARSEQPDLILLEIGRASCRERVYGPV